jgi:hypothetical protein
MNELGLLFLGLLVLIIIGLQGESVGFYLKRLRRFARKWLTWHDLTYIGLVIVGYLFILTLFRLTNANGI